MNSPAEIFFSYPGDDAQAIDQVAFLADRLEHEGFRCWIASRDRREQQGTGSAEILEALEATPVFVACVGGGEIGRWRAVELERAANRAVSDSSYSICSVLLPGAPADAVATLPPAFSRADVFDLREGVIPPRAMLSMLWRRLRPGNASLVEEIVQVIRQDPMPIVISGPTGTGKSALARAVAARVEEDFPGGTAFIRFNPTRPAEETMADILLRLGLPTAPNQPPYLAYQTHLSERRCLLVFEDVEADDVTALLPPKPSQAIFVAPRPPGIALDHHVFETPLPDDPSASVEIAELGVRPGYTSDAPDGDDLLSIHGPVDALCSVIAATDVNPPLSIGLFGDWGAGKTFFIEKMCRRIDALAAASREAERSAYCSSIHQIVFNAWHYADANLWASLASRVFEGLADQGGEAERLIATLESSRLQLEDADASRTAAGERLEQAREDEAKARRELSATEVELGDLANAAIDVFADTTAAGPLLQELRTELHRDSDDGVTPDLGRGPRPR